MIGPLLCWSWAVQCSIVQAVSVGQCQSAGCAAFTANKLKLIFRKLAGHVAFHLVLPLVSCDKWHHSLTHCLEPFSRKLHSIMCSLCMLSAGIITLTHTFSECDPVAALFSKQWLNDCPPLTCLPVLCSPRTTSALVYQNSRHCSTLAGIEKLWMNKKQQKKWQNVEFNQKVCSQRNLKFLASWQFWMLAINDP